MLLVLALAAASPSFSPPGTTVNGLSVDVAGKIGAVALLPTDKQETGVKRRASRFAVQPLAGGDTLVLVDTEQEETDNGETAWLVDDMIAARIPKDSKEGKPVWRQRLRNGAGDPTRQVFVTDQVVVLRQRDGVVAVDLANGKVRWVVDRDPLESVLNDPQFWQASLDDKTGVLWLGGRFPNAARDGRRSFELEVDVNTGQHVFKKTKWQKPAAEPIYVRPPFRLEYPGDKAPPEVPKDFDGRRVRRSFLAWSTTTGEGIVVGPLASDAPAILEAAKAAKVKKWLYVVDLGAVGRSGELTGKAPSKGGEIVLESDGAVERAGEHVDAAAIATALGATAITSVTQTTTLAAAAGAPVFFRPDGRDTTVCLQWGPYRFVDEHPRNWALEEAPF